MEVDLTGFSSQMVGAYICLNAAVIGVGGRLTPNSAYRPDAYQAHLKEVWDKATALKGNSEPACQQLKKDVAKEMLWHELVEPPATSSKHEKGEAFDASFSNVPGKTVSRLAQGCGLSQSKHKNGAHHFFVTPQGGGKSK